MHMHKHLKDIMNYVGQYNRPDIFITFNRNPNWIKITQLLLSGQSYSNHYEKTAQVFKQKLKVIMDIIVIYHVLRNVGFWMYSVEWKKNGLPHAHIIMLIIKKIRPDKIDAIIVQTFLIPKLIKSYMK